jgi:hypothetical protein
MSRGGIARLVAAVAICGPAVWQLSLQLRLWWSRFRYPFDIDWLESATLYQSWRMVHHQYTYSVPGRGYLPQFHPPGYFTFVASVGRVLGVDYAVARTISLCFFLLAIGVASRLLIRNEKDKTHGWTAALLAAGCAAAAVPLIESFYDLVRFDMMSWSLCMVAAALADERRPSPRRIGWLALVLTAAVYTRLVTVPLLVVVNVFVWARNRRAGWHLATVTTACCGLVLVGLQYVSEGYFWIYCVAVLQKHHVNPALLFAGLRAILDFAPFLPALPAAAVGLLFFRALRARTVLWLCLLGAAIPAALLPLAKQGGFANDYMPVALLIGPATLFVIADMVHALRTRPAMAMALRYSLYAAVSVFLLLRHYDLTRFIPTADHWQRARALNEMVAGMKGGVIVPKHPFLPPRMGHRVNQFSDMPYLDAWWAQLPGQNLQGYVDRTHANWALVSGTEVPPTARVLARRYQLERPIELSPATLIGERLVLRYLLRWQEAEHDARVVFDFEGPDGMMGWTITGQAFEASPTPTRPSWQHGIIGAEGERLANSFHRTQHDRATGRALSPAFTIDRNFMSLRIGGGDHGRVELYAEGRPVRTIHPVFRNQELLLKVVWDVSKYQGQEARIILVDPSSGHWGHLLCDHVVLFNRR